MTPQLYIQIGAAIAMLTVVVLVIEELSVNKTGYHRYYSLYLTMGVVAVISGAMWPVAVIVTLLAILSYCLLEIIAVLNDSIQEHREGANKEDNYEV